MAKKKIYAVGRHFGCAAGGAGDSAVQPGERRVSLFKRCRPAAFTGIQPIL